MEHPDMSGAGGTEGEHQQHLDDSSRSNFLSQEQEEPESSSIQHALHGAVGETQIYVASTLAPILPPSTPKPSSPAVVDVDSARTRPGQKLQLNSTSNASALPSPSLTNETSPALASARSDFPQQTGGTTTEAVPTPPQIPSPAPGEGGREAGSDQAQHLSKRPLQRDQSFTGLWSNIDEIGSEDKEEEEEENDDDDEENEDVPDRSRRPRKRLRRDGPHRDGSDSMDEVTRLPKLIAFKRCIHLLDERLAGFNKANLPPDSIDRIRLHVLRQACINEDLFYIVLHRLSCLWTTDPQKTREALPMTVDQLGQAFAMLIAVLGENQDMSHESLTWCSDFPEFLVDVVGFDDTSLQMSNFLINFLLGWTTLLYEVKRRKYPLLAYETTRRLRCPSPTFGCLLFTLSRRTVGVGEGPIAVQLEELFRRDQKKEGQLAQMDAPEETARLTRQSSLIQYQKLMQQAQQGTSVDALPARPGRRLANPSPRGAFPRQQQQMPQMPQMQQVQQPSHQPQVQVPVQTHAQRLQQLQQTAMNHLIPSPMTEEISQASHQLSDFGPLPTNYQSQNQVLSPLGDNGFPASQINSQNLSQSSNFVHSISSIGPAMPALNFPMYQELPSQLPNLRYPQSFPGGNHALQSISPNHISLSQQRQHQYQQHQRQHPGPVPSGFTQRGARWIRSTSAQGSPHALSPSIPLDWQQSNAGFVAQIRAQGQAHAHVQAQGQAGMISQAHHQLHSQQPSTHMHYNAQAPLTQPLIPSVTPGMPLTPTANPMPYQAQQMAPAISRPPSVSSAAQHQGRPPVPPTQPGQVVRNAAQPSSVQYTTRVLNVAEYPNSPHGWLSLQSGLHLVNLRSPKRIPSDMTSKRCIQFVDKFMVDPIRIEPQMRLSILRFLLSPEDFSKLSRSLKQSNATPICHVKSGCQRYRLRVCLKQEGSSAFDEGAWAVSRVSWPEGFCISMNGGTMMLRHKQHFHHDLPLELTDSLIAGENVVQILLPLNAPNIKPNVFYYVAVERVITLEHEAVWSLVVTAPHISMAETKSEIERRLKPAASDDIVVEIGTLTISVVDPFSSRLFDVPVRGLDCKHLECIDLRNWLDTRPSKLSRPWEPTMVDVWDCPICGLDARPSRIRIDDFFVDVRTRLLQSLNVSVKKIAVSATGDWISVEEPGNQPDATPGPEKVEALWTTQGGTAHAGPAPAAEIIEIIDDD